MVHPRDVHCLKSKNGRSMATSKSRGGGKASPGKKSQMGIYLDSDLHALLKEVAVEDDRKAPALVVRILSLALPAYRRSIGRTKSDIESALDPTSSQKEN